jgi:hypothetical protein
MKKEIMIGIIVLFAVFVVASVFLGQKSINLSSGHVQTKIVDSDLQKLPRQEDDPKLLNGGVIFSANGEGNLSTKVNFVSLALHSPFIDKWVILASVPRTLEFNEIPIFSGSATIDAMEYNGIYIYFPNITVIENGIEHNALMFKDRIYLPGYLIAVKPNEITYAQLTLVKNQSLFKTTEGDYVFVPTIRVRSWLNSTVTIKTTDEVVLDEGTLWDDIIIGTSSAGEIGAGLRVKSGDTISIGNRTVTLA